VFRPALVCSERPPPARGSLPAPEIRAFVFCLFTFRRWRRFRELFIARNDCGVLASGATGLACRCAPVHSRQVAEWGLRRIQAWGSEQLELPPFFAGLLRKMLFNGSALL